MLGVIISASDLSLVLTLRQRLKSNYGGRKTRIWRGAPSFTYECHCWKTLNAPGVLSTISTTGVDFCSTFAFRELITQRVPGSAASMRLAAVVE
jgi:hypothetical protein